MNILVQMIRSQMAEHERRIDDEVEAIGKLSAMEALALALPSGEITEEDVARVAAAEPRANFGAHEGRRREGPGAKKGRQLADAVLEVAGRDDTPNGDDPDARAEEEQPEGTMRTALVEVLEWVTEHGPARAREVANAIGRGSASVHADCEMLVASNHLVRDRIGRYEHAALDAA